MHIGSANTIKFGRTTYTVERTDDGAAFFLTGPRGGVMIAQETSHTPGKYIAVSFYSTGFIKDPETGRPLLIDQADLAAAADTAVPAIS